MTDSTPDSPGTDSRFSFLLIEPSEYNLILLVLRRLFLCLILLFLMGLGALAMWLDTDRRYSGFFLAMVAFSGTLAVVRRGAHLHEGEALFADDDDVINTYLTSPNESPKHSTNVYHHQHRVCLGPPPQFSDENPEPVPAVHQHVPRRAGWNQPPPPYHMACPEPPPAYADVVPNLMDQNTPSTSRQHPALADVLFHGTYAPSDDFVDSQMPSTSRGFAADSELTQVLTDGQLSESVPDTALPSLETSMQDQQAGPSSAQ